MAVTVNNRASAVTTINANTTLDNANLTVAAGSNTILIAMIGFNGPNTGTVTSVNWDATGTPQPMTEIDHQYSATAGDYVGMYYLKAPTTGNKTLRVVLNGARDQYLYAIAFDGVDDTSQSTAIPTADVLKKAATEDPFTIGPITCPSGDMALSMLVPTSVDPQGGGASHTQEFLSTTANNINTAGQSSTATNPTHTWDLSASGELSGMAIHIKAAGGGGTTLTPAQAASVLTGQGISLGFAINMPDEP